MKNLRAISLGVFLLGAKLMFAQGLTPGSMPPSPDDYPEAPAGKIRYITLSDLPSTWQDFFRRTEIGHNELRKKSIGLDPRIKPSGSIPVEFIDSYKPFLLKEFSAADKTGAIAQVKLPELARMRFDGYLPRARMPDQSVVTVGRVWRNESMRVLFEEWDYARAGVGVVVRSDLALHDVHGTPAQLAAIGSDDGKLLVAFIWTTSARGYSINIEGRTADYEKLTHFALEMARSVSLASR